MRILVPLAILLLTACHKDEPPAPSAEQTARLDDAEAMLNDLSANEEGPEANASSPSNPSE